MKSNSILSILLLALFSFTIKPKPILKISFGSIKNGEVYIYDTQNLTTDTIKIKNGILEFHKDITQQRVFHLTVKNYNTWERPIRLVLSSLPTTLSFKNFLPVNTNGNINELYPNQPTFTQDPNQNAAYYAFQNKWLSFFQHISSLTPKEGTPDTQFEERKKLYAQFILDSEVITTSQKDGLVGALILEHLLRENLLPAKKKEQLYSLLNDDVQNNSYSLSIEADVKIRAGAMAPKFSVQTIQGESINLEAYKGKKVLLHFWASTCAPCIEEAPKLLALEKLENARNLIILNISVDTNRNHWYRGINRAGFQNLVNVSDLKGSNEGIGKEYAIRGIPRYYLITEEGKIALIGNLSEIREIL